jgi:subtilisin family serine protease
MTSYRYDFDSIRTATLAELEAAASGEVDPLLADWAVRLEPNVSRSPLVVPELNMTMFFKPSGSFLGDLFLRDARASFLRLTPPPVSAELPNQWVETKKTKWTGRGVRAVVIDTGFHATEQRCFNFSNAHDCNDLENHGWKAARMFRGFVGSIAPNTQLYGAKVSGTLGIKLGSVMSALLWALQIKAHICSLSIGDNRKPDDVPNPYFQAAFSLLRSKGCLAFAAAGNVPWSDYVALSTYAACSDTIAVGGASGMAPNVFAMPSGENQDRYHRIDCVGPFDRVYCSDLPDMSVFSHTSAATAVAAATYALHLEASDLRESEGLSSFFDACVHPAPGIGHGLVRSPR